MAAQVLQPQSVNGGGGASGGGGAQQFVLTSLYVGDLEMNVTDSQLYEFFNQLGHVVSVRVCRDLATRRSLGYGYVNYDNPQDAARAIEVLNFTPLNGKSIRIMYSHYRRVRKRVRKRGSGNIFIKMRDAGISQAIPIGALASALANASPTEQRTMLRENLYPLVEQLEAEAAAKVTGMLLEMYQTEVLHLLLESPEALKAKVAGAMDVLKYDSQQQQQGGGDGGGGSPADQLAALSLNDTIVS